MLCARQCEQGGSTRRPARRVHSSSLGMSVVSSLGPRETRLALHTHDRGNGARASPRNGTAARWYCREFSASLYVLSRGTQGGMLLVLLGLVSPVLSNSRRLFLDNSLPRVVFLKRVGNGNFNRTTIHVLSSTLDMHPTLSDAALFTRVFVSADCSHCLIHMTHCSLRPHSHPHPLCTTTHTAC